MSTSADAFRFHEIPDDAAWCGDCGMELEMELVAIEMAIRIAYWCPQHGLSGIDTSL